MKENAKPVGAKAAGSLRNRQWGTVYTGSDVCCYKVKFSSFTGPSNAGRDPSVGIYVDGDQAGNQAATITVGQSKDVCGRKILVYGFLHEAQVAFWEASEIKEIDWF